MSRIDAPMIIASVMDDYSRPQWPMFLLIDEAIGIGLWPAHRAAVALAVPPVPFHAIAHHNCHLSLHIGPIPASMLSGSVSSRPQQEHCPVLRPKKRASPIGSAAILSTAPAVVSSQP